MTRRYISTARLPFISITPIKRKNAPTTKTTFRKKWTEPFIIKGFAYCIKPTKTAAKPNQNKNAVSLSNLTTSREYVRPTAIAIRAPVSKPKQPAQ